jgi:hypothetical protein
MALSLLGILGRVLMTVTADRKGRNVCFFGLAIKESKGSEKP